MKKLLFFIPFIIISCNDDDSNYDSNLATTIHVKYLFENNFNIIVPGENNQLKLSYKNDKLIKFEGGSFADPYSGNYTFYFNKLTEFTYSNNSILKKSRDNLRNYEYANQTSFILDGNNVMSTEENNTEDQNDFITYQSYTYKQNQLSRILTYKKYPGKETYEEVATERLFYFNSVGNLDSIVQQNLLVDNDLNTFYDSSRFKNKSVKVLKDYDQAPNPFKKMFLLEDFFDRSLSKNNFNKVSIKEYSNDRLQYTYNYNLNYNYMNGKIDLTY